MGRYGGHECGKCGGSHRGVCPAYYDETEAMIDEERRQGRVCRCGDPACPHRASCYSFVKKQGPTSLADAMGVEGETTVELFINDGTTPLWGDNDSEEETPVLRDMIRKTSFEMEEPGINENWLRNTFNCPSCGTETLNGDCPAFAPDYICMECHVEWMDEHDDWREDTMQRIKHHMEKEPTVD